MASRSSPLLKSAESHLERSRELIETARVHWTMLHRQIERSKLLLNESRRLLGESAPGAVWAPGTPCSLPEGSFCGHPAIVLDVVDGYATVSIMMLGALREILVPVDRLAPRDAD